MHRLKLPSPRVAAYIALVALLLAGLEILGVWVAQPVRTSFGWPDLLFWGLLISWAEHTAIHLPYKASMSSLFLVALAAGIIFPPWVAGLLVLAFYYSPDFGKPSYPLYADLFNRLQTAAATAAASLGYWVFAYHAKLLLFGLDFSSGLGVAVGAMVFIVVNVGLVNGIITLTFHTPYRKLWYENFGWLLPSYLVLSPVALLLARAYAASPPILGSWGGFAVMLFLVPIYYARFHWDEVVRTRESFEETVNLLMNAVDAKDSFTRLHTERVAAISVDLAKAAGLDEADLKKIGLGARLHDIGKISIPDRVLFKPERLSKEEYALVQSHAVRGEELLKSAHPMKEILPIVRSHHERWDGRGYPDGLAGQNIPQWARVVSVADAYEAMTAGRPYQRARTPEEGLAEILDVAGDQLDPELTHLFGDLWQTDPTWKDREVFLREFSSLLPFSGSFSPPSSEPVSRTSENST